MNTLKSLGLAALLALGVSGALVQADTGSPRQYYGGWQKHASKDYYYINYYYKPTPDYAGYKHQYALYYPNKPDYYYFYNPYKKQFWGRCPSKLGGVAQYSMLPPAAQGPDLNKIPETSFPTPTTPPPVPEVSKVEKNPPQLELPPDPPQVSAGKVDSDDLP